MGKKIICHCEDIDVEEVYSALAQGFGDLETLRRYTGIGTGKCQGKCCLVQTLRILASQRAGSGSPERPPGLTGDPGRIRLPTVRQPVLPLRIDDIIEAQAGDVMNSEPSFETGGGSSGDEEERG
jgi:bacterioferritin-associated ferredoxin